MCLVDSVDRFRSVVALFRFISGEGAPTLDVVKGAVHGYQEVILSRRVEKTAKAAVCDALPQRKESG